MDLEPIEVSINIDRLKDKLKKKYPNHNFDIPSEPDRKCKAPVLCNSTDKIKYSDKDGNIFCGQRYKLIDNDNPYKWEWSNCHAMLQSVDEQKNFKDMQSDIF
jgi:hypothetical protein